VLQALSRDIRSVTQRIKVPGREERGEALPALAAAGGKAAAGGPPEGKWHVVLDGIEITYEVEEDGGVTIRSAAPPVPP
jgi:hypothetical protein